MGAEEARGERRLDDENESVEWQRRGRGEGTSAEREEKGDREKRETGREVGLVRA